MEQPTGKQIERIRRLVEHKGHDFVSQYFYRKFPDGNFELLTKEQAQKIITGLQTHEPRTPIFGVAGRDVSFQKARIQG